MILRFWRKVRKVKMAELDRVERMTRDSLSRANADLASQQRKLWHEQATIGAHYDQIISDNALAERVRKAFGGIS